MQVFRDALPREWDGLVAQRRGDLRPEFFDHIRFMMASATANKNAVEHDALNAMASRLVTLVRVCMYKKTCTILTDHHFIPILRTLCNLWVQLSCYIL